MSIPNPNPNLHRPWERSLQAISRRVPIRESLSLSATDLRLMQDTVIRMEEQAIPPFTDSDLVVARVYDITRDTYAYHRPGFLGDFQAIHCVRLPDKVVVLVAVRDDYAVVEDERHLFPSDELTAKLRMLL